MFSQQRELSSLADGDYDRLPALAADLVRRQVSVIVATGGEPSGRAAKAAKREPDGRGTVTKQLGLLHELIPQAQVIAMLVDPNFPRTDSIMRNAHRAAGALEWPRHRSAKHG
jgi:hypothetical protein